MREFKDPNYVKPEKAQKLRDDIESLINKKVTVTISYVGSKIISVSYEEIKPLTQSQRTTVDNFIKTKFPKLVG